MRKSPAIALTAFLFAVFSLVAGAQEQPSLEMWALKQVLADAPEGHVDYDFAAGAAHGTNGVFIKYGGATLMADTADMSLQTGEVKADGHVRIEQGDLVWVGDHIRYNFKTRQMQSEQFRTGKSPVYAAGGELQGDLTNKTYQARHAFVTTDDVSDPAIRVRASHIKIVPGKYV